MDSHEKKLGRPSIKSDEILTVICERLAKGESLPSICKDEQMPGFSTVFAWLDKDKAFQESYARARAIQADRYFDEIIDIADEGEADFTVDDEGNSIVDHENIQRSRLKVDARKWVAAKLLPKKYGDIPNKTEVNVSTAVVILDPQRQEQLQARRKQAELEAIKTLTDAT